MNEQSKVRNPKSERKPDCEARISRSPGTKVPGCRAATPSDFGPRISCLLLAGLVLLSAALPAAVKPAWLPAATVRAEAALVERHGASQRPRIQQGLRQVSDFWRATDGDSAVFETFVAENYAGDPATRDALFERFQRRMEVLDGLLNELRYEFKLHTDLERGPILPFDELFSAYEPSAHLTDDFFANKLAFVVLLNFPITTLDERLTDGEHWSRRQWAEARLTQRFSKRIPADVLQASADAQAAAEIYINEYKIWMHHVLDAEGRRLFPPKLALITHWNLRDEIKAQYSATTNGLACQRLIQRVMERIIDQSIPQLAVNNPTVDWSPFSNGLKPAAASDSDQPAASAQSLTNAPEPDSRYAMLLAIFRASQKADMWSPTEPTLIARRFAGDRQMSEARVKDMLEQVLRSPQFAQVGALIAKRLGRPLEPFDLWYNGFRPRGAYTEAQLDEKVRQRYPTAAAYQADMTNILQKLGFTSERAAYLQSQIDIESSRGTGHAMGAAMRGQKSRLRTRVEKDGMNYKGFNIAVHEMGHNIEQTFSLNEVDQTLLAGVPNNSFTEALAMVAQGHDLEILGLSQPDARTAALGTLDTFWQTAEIAGVALVDMAVWHWMYDHPEATPAELKAATVGIAKDLWNRFYAPVFHQRDVTLLAIYSHMIRDVLYLPDYPIGHLIQFQLEERMRQAGNFGAEFERVAKFGNLTPDLWMKNATGAPVGADALLRATGKALAEMQP